MRLTNMCFMRLPLCGAAVLLSTASHAATYFVSPGGSDANSGTSPATAWHSIQKASDVMTAGDTALIADGHYVGGIEARTSGTPTAPITFMAVHPGAAVVDGNPLLNQNEFKFYRCDNVVLDGLSIVGGMRGIRIDNSQNCVVRRCVVTNSVITGILTDFSDDALIEYNECAYSISQHGIYVSSAADRPIVRYNVCHHNGRAGIQLNGDGKHLNPAIGTRGDGFIQDAQIIGNICYQNGQNNMAAALNLMSVRTSLVANNLIYNNLAGGISLWNDNIASATQWGCKNNRILNNTILFQPGTGRWCISARSGSSGNVVENNILFGGGRGAYEFDMGSIPMGDYNLLPNAGAPGIAMNADTQAFYNLSQWQLLSGGDLHSSDLDPLFVNATTPPFDLRVLTGSPALNGGVWHPDVTTDILGELRPVGALSDIGCFQQGTGANGIASLVIAPSQLVGGASAIGTITLSGPAPAGGATISLAGNSSSVSVPVTVTIPSGGLSSTFAVTTRVVSSIVPAIVTASWGTSRAGATLTLTASPLVNLSDLSVRMTDDNLAEGTITLTAAAPHGGVVIPVSTDSPLYVSVPATVVIPEGTTSATFSMPTSSTGIGHKAVITATSSGVTKSATLTIN